MAITNCGLTEVQRTKRQYEPNQARGFSRGDVREAFQRVFSPEETYVLFQTVANAQAAKALKQYIGFRDNMSAPWRVRKIRKGDDLEYVPGARDDGNGLLFDNSLMDSFQGAIDEIANEDMGGKNFSHYPLVSTSGVHSLDRDPNAIFWPTVYIVTDKKQSKLKEIIDELIGDKGFDVLRRRESPQFYQMAEIEILHKLRIAPLVRLERELRVGAQDLLLYVDFLAQMIETYRWTGSVIDVD